MTLALASGCHRDEPQTRVASSARSQATAETSAAVSVAPALSAVPAAPPPVSEERTLFFPWRPRGASLGAYALDDPRDQHRLVVMRGVSEQPQVDVVIAMHGQPRRGELPRNYAFVRTVTSVTRGMVEAGLVQPVVLAIPVFRFEGENWPAFNLKEFIAELDARLRTEGLVPRRYSAFGHSGAAGCGGHGLNRAAESPLGAVGFFDTCVGPGFVSAVRALEGRAIPTLVMHSVETAGFRPRQATEYLASFDFGRVYEQAGLSPSLCPLQLPQVPLRKLRHRCARSSTGDVQALVVDTGEGERAHEAIVPVALRYFLTEYVAKENAPADAVLPPRSSLREDSPRKAPASTARDGVDDGPWAAPWHPG